MGEADLAEIVLADLARRVYLLVRRETTHGLEPHGALYPSGDRVTRYAGAIRGQCLVQSSRFVSRYSSFDVHDAGDD